MLGCLLLCPLNGHKTVLCTIFLFIYSKNTIIWTMIQEKFINTSLTCGTYNFCLSKMNVYLLKGCLLENSGVIYNTSFYTMFSCRPFNLCEGMSYIYPCGYCKTNKGEAMCATTFTNLFKPTASMRSCSRWSYAIGLGSIGSSRRGGPIAPFRADPCISAWTYVRYALLRICTKPYAFCTGDLSLWHPVSHASIQIKASIEDCSVYGTYGNIHNRYRFVNSMEVMQMMAMLTQN